MSKYSRPAACTYHEVVRILHTSNFYLDASFWIFSHLLICNFNAKLKMISPFYHAYFEKGSNRKITKLCIIYIYISVLRSHKTMCYSPSYNINRLKSFVSNWYRSYKFSIYGKLLEFAKILSPSKSGQDMSANKKWFLKGFVTPPSKMLRRPFNIYMLSA